MSKLHSAKAAIASSGTSRRLKRSAWLVSAAMAAIVLANPAHAQLASNALPTGGTVVGGSASIGTPTPSNSMTVTQSSDRAVINWNTFDIGSGASVTFVQPSTTAIAVNRVTGGGPASEIAGQLTANGRIAILNPNGVLFSGGSTVNVGSLIATTGDIDTNAFMAGGNMEITGATGTGEIVVNGNINITAGNLGLAAFVAPTVRNSGIITATAGRVQLGGGTAFTLDLAGDGLLSIGVPASSALVQNNGQIFAEGGRIQMTAKSAGAAVDNLVNTGTLSVDSATLDNGTIVLQAVGGTANLSGTVAANDRNSIGQNIQISSDRGVNISGNLSGASGTVNITAPHIWGAGKVSTATALMLNISNDGTDTTGLGNYINDALGVIGTAGFGTTLKLGAGTYRSGVVVNASDVRIDGQGVARIGWTSGIENAIDIWGDRVTIQNLEISGPATSGYTSFAWGSTNSRGIFVNRYADGVQLINNNIHDIRTGIIVDGRNTNTHLLNNTIDNTKSAISIQYTDGSNVDMTGNHGSAYGNEWGINLYLNGILQGDGVTILPSAGSLGANTPLAEQQRLLALRAANGNMEVQNQGYSALNRTAVYVGPAGSNSNQGSQLGKLATIQAGVNAVVTGGAVYVADGNYSLGASQLVINHALSLIGASQAGVVIDGRAVSANGLGTISVIADNVSLSNFTLMGSTLSGGNYGIKVQPNPAGHVNTAGGTSERVSNFAISNVTVSGSRRAELDLNGVVGATITNFTANGQGTDGAGVQITDSANVTLTGVHTLGNNWGGVALYQSNSASAYNAQTTNINIDAAQNNFEEANGLFTQDSSATQDFGQLNLAGFNYAVRNIGSRPDASQFVWFQTDLTKASAFATTLPAATTSSIEGWNGTGFNNQFNVFDGMSITAALRDADAGATISVAAGNYLEGVTGVDYYGGAGGQQFGLYVAKDNITIRGVDASGATITDADNVVAFITAANQAGFGAQHFISGSGVTIEGLGFKPAATGDNKTVEVIGDAFTLRNSVIDNRGNETAANLYIDDFNDPARTRVETFTITGNKFYGGTYASAMVVVAAGAGRNTPASGRIFTSNLVSSDLVGMRGFQIQGYMPNTPWQLLEAGAVTVTGNIFDVDIPVRTVGVLSGTFDWDGVFHGNDFVRGGVLAFQGDSANARGIVTAGGDLDIRITSSITDQLARAQSGDTVRLLDGTYVLGGQLALTTSVKLVGQSEAGTIIDGRNVNNGGGLGTIGVYADNTTLSNFTLLGSTLSGGNYGIKVQPNPTGYAPSQRINNIAISNVTVSGSRRAELDINGANGVTITNVTANGQGTEGAGIQITDSANVTLTGVHTLGNNWGGVALYQTNRAGGYDGQTTNINIAAADNQFEEANGLFAQLESTTQGFGTLNLTGYGYAVRNFASRADGSQFTYFRTDLADATAWATSLGAASSSLEGYTGTGYSNVFTVLDGFTIAAAMRDVRSGGTVNIGAGTFNEAVSITKSLTLDGAGMGLTSLTGGIAITSGFTGLTLSDFTVSGSANGTSVIGNSGTLTDLTMSRVQIDGGNVANRHGFIGGQIGGDIAISNSEFLNIRGWAAFDTRSGASGNDGAQIASAVFTENLLYNTVGHIAFRQQAGAATLPDVTFSGNLVTNVGDATNSFGAIFKAFNANTVDVVGNVVDGVGTSGFNPAGEAAYGAVLMTRGVTTLNVTGNEFSNNNQVFAVEPGRGLPTNTNFSNNIFSNNVYSIYLPGSMTGAGTINFGAGNNFEAGRDTVQHIVWRSSATLDLTNVLFDGALASTYDLDGRFALADLITDGIDVSGAGLARLVAGQVYVTATAGADSLKRAAAIAATGDTVNVAAGTYSSGTMIATNGVSLLGVAGARIDASHDGDNGITINADGVSVSGFEIFGPADQSFVTYGWPTITRGVVVANGADNVTVTGNNIHDVRNGILIDGRNLNTALTSNVIDNTKSGISVQYTDGSNLNIAGNSEGSFGNEWGVITYLNGIWNGTTITASAGALGANTPLSEQQRLLALSAANNGMAVYNQGYSAANRTRAYVDPTGSAGAQGSQRTLLNLQGGLDAVVRGGTVHIAGGTYNENVSLNALRVLDMASPITVTSLAFGAGAAGTNIGTSITATGALSFAAAPVLTGNTVLTGDTVSLGAITSSFGLTLNGANGVSIGLADLASLVANGSDILTAGVITTGAQHYTGDVTLNGEYRAQGSFTVTGLATLASDSLVGSSSTIALGGVTGAHGFTVAGAAITLGPVTGLASLSATAATISTAGASTTGTQRYAGATTLNGAYSTGGELFVVDGATTLGGDVSVNTNGMVANFTGAITGAHDLVVDAGSGNVFFGGAVSGLTSLSATGAAISTLGVATHGNQLYVGATILAGTYATDGGSLTVQGASSVTAATSILTNGGAATLGAVNTGSNGVFDLAIDAGAGQVTLGTTFARTLSVTGATITTAGAGTNGAQTYNGATTLNGTYNASNFTVNGATTLGGNTSIGGTSAVLGSVGGTGALNITETGTVALGTVSGIASLAARGQTITTAGVTTTGSQSYDGTVLLNGIYGASSFTAGAAQVTADSTVTTNGGLASFESATGAGNLTVNAGAGEVRFRTISGLASVVATGNTITLLGNATTTGAQTYTGTTTLGGQYQTGGAFTINGAATTTDSTTVTTGGGNARFGAIAGAGTLTINAGAGNVTLGALSNFAISATGATILTSGGNTGGAQTYNGATTLVGSYSTGNTVQGSAFTVNGTTTLGGNTNVTARGNAVFGAINATGSDLTVNALGNGNVTLGAGTGLGALSVTGSSVTLGALANLGSVSVTGTSIVTAGAATSGAQTYTGTTTLNGTYSAGGNFTVNGSSVLAGGTNVTTGGNARFAAVVGTGSLGVTANGSATLGSVNNIASLSVTGASIALVNVRTTGAQSYTGATSMNGVYNAGGDFTVNGATTFGGNTGITAGGNVTFGTIGGTGGVGVTATNGNITLGAVTGLSSLSVRGASIVTSGATTSGAQLYMGAISLNGAYATNGGVFTVVGAATLAGNTSIATAGGTATLGTVSATGTGNGLAVNAGTGNVTLGAATGLGSLTATGATITTAGAATSGVQSYTGATTLNGIYTAGGNFTVGGTTTVAASTSVTTGGNAGFAAVGGTGGLGVTATGGVTLGAVNGLASLSVTGATIATSGASTSGAQSYIGATSLNGAYSTNGGAFSVNGAATTVNAVTVATAGGNAGFGTVGGAGGLAVDAGTGSVTLGAVSGIASLSATGATIATAGASTLGAQSYTGATSLNGAYSTNGGAFTVNGASTLGAATSVATGGGNAGFGTVGGTGSLSVDAGAGSASLGAVSGLAGLSVTGASIATNGAATSGAQSYTGATSLNGAYTTGGGAFTVSGAANLAGTTSVTSGNGGITLGAVDAAVAGTQGLALNAGTGSVALGNLGAVRRLGATSVNAGSTVLNGATYAANSLAFTGGTGSTVRMTQGTTTFNTTQPGGAGGTITIAPDLLGTVNAQQNVAFLAGNGLTANSGDVAIGNAGSDAVRLGTMTVTGHDFSAATVKLAGTFTSVLSGSQVFTANTLDTLGNVNALVAGTESGSIRAGGSVTIDAGGSGSGLIVAGGAVNAQYDASVNRTITSQGSVTVQSLGAIGGSVTAGGAVNLQTTTGAITGTVNATGPVSATSTSGGISAAITSNGAVNVGTTSGAITGSVTAGGPVTASSTSGNITAPITSNGAVNVGTTSGTVSGTVNAGGPVAITTTSGGVTATVTTPGTASVTSQTGTVNAAVTGNGGVSVSTNGSISGTYSSPTAIDLTSTRPVDVQVNGTAVTVTAPGGSITGVFTEIHTNDTGTFVVNEQPVVGSGTTDARQIIIDTFITPTRGTVSANGEIQLPAGLALGLIAPAGNGQGGQRPAVVVNNVQRLGELLREGYTAIIIQLDESNLDVEEEVAGQ